jgi:uncharacterized protein YfaS (alpha-2-macroglobulin family)
MKRRVLVLNLLAAAAMLFSSCSLPIGGPLAVKTTPTATPEPLPPVLAEIDPPSGSQLPLDRPITLYFSLPMDRASTEAAINLSPSGNGGYEWLDDSTLQVRPPSPFTPEMAVTLTIAASARAANGLSLTGPVTLEFTTADYLKPLQFLPAADSKDIPANAAVALTFNQPVVALGADPASGPAAFSLSPSAGGRGEWLNTSTYIFYPDGLSGGVTYSVKVNPRLKAASGSGLAPDSAGAAWEFTPAPPRLVTIAPDPNLPLTLDGTLTLTFNQPMDTASVEAGLVLTGPQGLVDFKPTWDETGTILTVTPKAQLGRNTDYTLTILGADAHAPGGTPMGANLEYTYRTYPSLAIIGTKPANGGTIVNYGGPQIFFSAPLKANQDWEKFITVQPEIDFSAYTSDGGTTLGIGGYMDADTSYTMTIASGLEDLWGGKLETPYTFSFRTAPATPQLYLMYYGTSAFFVRPGSAALKAQAVNIHSVRATVAPLGMTEFLDLQSGGYDTLRGYQPASPVVLPQTFNLPANRTGVIDIRLGQGNTPLETGIYYVRLDAQEAESNPTQYFYAVASNVNVTFKSGVTDALVWAVDLESGDPLANAPVAVYSHDGQLLASGQTDQNGLWKSNLATIVESGPAVVMIGQPGDKNFGLALTSWNDGISTWDFDLYGSRHMPVEDVYVYTDRPIYRPGHTVYFRGAVRQAFYASYQMPQKQSVTLSVHDDQGQELTSLTLPLSQYGTFNGQYTLPEDSRPGYYSIVVDEKDANAYLSFQVAEYRKPEMELAVTLDPDPAMRGQHIKAGVQADYYFGAPAGNVKVHWTAYLQPARFYLPGYRVGVSDLAWMNGFDENGRYGTSLAEGDAVTDADGSLSVQLPAIPESDSLRTLTVEVSAQDESGFVLSAHADVPVHPAPVYIGVQPDQWFGQAGADFGFDLLTVDWEQKPIASQKLTAQLSRVTWDNKPGPYGGIIYKPIYTPVGSTDLATGTDGKARVSFTPDKPGVYRLEVRGDRNVTQLAIWVGGRGDVVWPSLPDDRIELVADREKYKPGDTAQIFIPNPFAQDVQALVTVERGAILDAQVISVAQGGSTFTLPLTAAHAPNVFVSATLLGPGSGFKMGYANLKVKPVEQTLNVELTADPTQAGPRDEVTLDLLVTDFRGQPAQGEFSLAVVDKAVLALADPNSQDIATAYYSDQPLGVITGMSLAALSERIMNFAGGKGGGGGGGDIPSVRENFPDTAYWNPAIVTDAQGKAQVKVTLPDSLTTWSVETRGLTTDTRVGQADTEIVTSKPLLVRPETPRFLVAGDHALMAAIVHNNTGQAFTAQVSLQAIGFRLDDAGKLTQEVVVPANGRTRVEWWGTAESADAVELIFSAKAGDLQDSTRPVWGSLPVLHYTVPQTFVTAGVIPEAGSRLELISLPRSFDPTAGSLDVEMAPSLAGVILSALDKLESPQSTDSNDTLLSKMLPNLEMYRLLQGANLEDQNLHDRVAVSLDSSVRLLLARQQGDGGWGWWSNGGSDPYLSAWILFGLSRAMNAGVQLNAEAIQRGNTYLAGALPHSENGEALQAWQLERAVFMEFALAQSGAADATTVDSLYAERERIDPYARGLLAITIDSLTPGDERAKSLLDGLSATALRTSSGAYWQGAETGIWIQPDTALFNTGVVVYALAQRDPSSPLLADAVRYLASQREANGLWGSPYESAWVLLGLTEALRGSGDLQASFDYSASLNGRAVASGQAGGAQSLNATTTSISMGDMYGAGTNALTVLHGDGTGRLYYRAALNVQRPVEDAKPISRGLQIERAYYDAACKKDCQPISSLKLVPGAQIKVVLTLTLPNDGYYVQVEDYIPAGSEVLDQSLKTSQQGQDATEVHVSGEPSNPFFFGWGWWLFNSPQIFDDHILWTADSLSAGTYTLAYTLVPVQAGEYHVLPAHAWLSFFPEVQATGAGTVFTIEP